MNKATELISGEHRQVEELFDRFLRQPERATAIELCAMLERHTEMEEHVLYPELRAVDEELYADAKREHEEADQLIQQIRQSHDLDQMTGLVRKLQASVLHHVEDEETEDLPAMERSCGTGRKPSAPMPGAKPSAAPPEPWAPASTPAGAPARGARGSWWETSRQAPLGIPA